ncbi:hypothetical protein BCR36DRAFT_586810 [Piromyces finnis]|uniref:Secreted protein n=1 Tax=Piromyces finnis TaxID=1754191 RepID=A0A1Y1UXS7_9FUNG|nr:hypothetical protein BCR36DRAFT_586809 [Piromyces finnis]ORX43132.1 hypothetical protein BCR36DRAFT_586810 [Piromyces finnis]|eukprot:ORX43131.1 hypothetical protein BCR36DRAFT_586809 [Piromyces finnis]
MQFNLKYLLALLAVPAALAYIDEPCKTDIIHGEGVCIKSSDCKMYSNQKGSVYKYAGTSSRWPCPNDPDDVICCVKKVSTLKSGIVLKKTGRCLNVSNCSTKNHYLVNTAECPGSDNVKLCVPN